VAGTVGRKEAGKAADEWTMSGSDANHAGEGSKQHVSGAIDGDESMDYVLDDMLGPRAEDLLDEDLDPRLRALLTDRLERSLNDRLDLDTRVRLSEANTVIARRIAEHHAFEAIFRRVSPG